MLAGCCRLKPFRQGAPGPRLTRGTKGHQVSSVRPLETIQHVRDPALHAGVRCASLVGGNPEARQAALHSFLHDPDCRVLLLLKSTTGGAAGGGPRASGCGKQARNRRPGTHGI